MILAFQSLIHAAALMLICLGFGLMIWGLVKNEKLYLKLGLAGTGISALIAFATR